MIPPNQPHCFCLPFPTHYIISPSFLPCRAPVQYNLLSVHTLHWPDQIPNKVSHTITALRDERQWWQKGEGDIFHFLQSQSATRLRCTRRERQLRQVQILPLNGSFDLASGKNQVVSHQSFTQLQDNQMVNEKEIKGLTSSNKVISSWLLKILDPYCSQNVKWPDWLILTGCQPVLDYFMPRG